MATEIWQATRAKGRPARWAFRVIRNDEVVFDSAWVSVRYRARADAVWLAEVINALCEGGHYRGRPGHETGATPPVAWSGDLGDDCSASVDDLYLHAEHLSGPVRGGAWYCSVTRGGNAVFHTADHGIEPRSGEAARWLCELVVSAVLVGILS